jgi:hypothetical protein
MSLKQPPSQAGTAPRPLAYSSLGVGSPRRRRLIRIAIIAGICGSSYAGIKFVVPQCFAFSNQLKIESIIAPQGTVIYTDSPAAIPSYRNNAIYQEYDMGSGGHWISRHSIWIQDPDDKRTRSCSGLAPTGLMRAKGGPWRLIGLSAFSEYLGVGRHRVNFPNVEVCSRATLWPGTRCKQIGYFYDKIDLNDGDELTVYQGRVDPADPSHLSIDYAINGVKGVIDGWLKPNDKMVFFIRSGPASTRPSQRFLATPLK